MTLCGQSLTCNLFFSSHKRLDHAGQIFVCVWSLFLLKAGKEEPPACLCIFTGKARAATRACDLRSRVNRTH